MRRMLVAAAVALMLAGPASPSKADVPTGQCKKVDPSGQENKCLRDGAPAAPHCDEIKSPAQRERCLEQAPGN